MYLSLNNYLRMRSIEISLSYEKSSNIFFFQLSVHYICQNVLLVARSIINSDWLKKKVQRFQGMIVNSSTIKRHTFRKLYGYATNFRILTIEKRFWNGFFLLNLAVFSIVNYNVYLCEISMCICRLIIFKTRQNDMNFTTLSLSEIALASLCLSDIINLIYCSVSNNTTIINLSVFCRPRSVTAAFSNAKRP